MTKAPPPFPTREEIARFVRESTTPVTRREIARAFHIRGDDRRQLKAILKELEEEGVLDRERGRKMAPPGALPAVAVLDVADIDPDGEVLARPANWDDAARGAPPRIFLLPVPKGQPALAVGARVLARLERLDDTTYEARTIRRLGTGAGLRIVGLFRRNADGGGAIEPTDRRQKAEIYISPQDAAGAQDGELVIVEASPGQHRLPGHRGRRATIVERLGDPSHPRAISLIAIAQAGIPVEFPQEVLEACRGLTVPPLGRREDLRRLPLVTIDGADARDFDDAVFAEPDSEPANPGGWRLVVAIADVAHYVRPGSPLDREALKRGNSAYFPDRVVPMLPEALSNDLCSLKPGEPRACLAVLMRIDAKGQLLSWRFQRALMRSAARLTYEQVQAARDGRLDDTTGPLADTVIGPLYGAFRALEAARRKRGTLELDLPERVIELSPEGRVDGVGTRRRLDSHRLIEEFMILANVAAASALQERAQPGLYRVHDEPDRVRIQALSETLAGFGYRLARGQVLKPRAFTQILAQAKGKPEEPLVNELILRSQAQAAYSPDNIGHFGLALSRYAHFTSPIRRYADLVVHRALIRLFGLGDGAMSDEEMLQLDRTAQHVSETERQAQAAERDATDRYLAAYLSDRIGAEFAGRITGVTRFGLFVSLDETGADGLVPISTLPDDYYRHDERTHALIGDRWRRVYRIGAPVRVRLVEADPISGSTLLVLAGRAQEDGADLPGFSPPADMRGRGPGRGGSRRDGRPPSDGRARGRR